MRRTAAQQSKQLFRAQLGCSRLAAQSSSHRRASVARGQAAGRLEWSTRAAIPPCLKRTIHLSPVTRLMPNWRQSAILLYFWLSQALMNISRCCMTFVCLQGMGISEGAIP